ncbi:peptide deformylase [Candidatus Gottesmanbacteria bacterium]|nr:peptide deformylase [Candidatus Gottesmanbacteria bacterium]
MKSIVVVPHSVLTTSAKQVVSFDSNLLRLIADMKQTLHTTKNPKGVGLAAPQIGESYRIFVTRPKETAMIRVFINPRIVSATGETDGVPERTNKLEGCLSIPNIWGRVKRNQSLILHYQDEKGTTHEEAFTGFLATIIQHEIDHVDGILFTQRVLEQKGKMYQATKDKEGKEILEEISI